MLGMMAVARRRSQAPRGTPTHRIDASPGLTVVRPDDVLGFLGGRRVRVIPGIGPKTEAALGERGIATVADLRAVEPARLAEWFGKPALEESHRAAPAAPVGPAVQSGADTITPTGMTT